ncbi:WD40-repeat-containing domain-containing protein [Dioscorea alata]|uniref:WD40-repeat-containing domain-containing protein n=1 Tax=Dioscorea alata TaxID=55571 RepID=A0ACB7VVB0_DIOAL|nr:WD40-repeat-containing domain-containing protein [Dioscorea alata]
MAGDWELRAGPYLGEISALAFLPLPPNISTFPLLLAGTGSELLLHDVQSGDLIKSVNIFEGVRVHGIAVIEQLWPFFSVAVFGERRIKLFRLRIDTMLSVNVDLFLEIPRFDHWVLDLCFLKEEGWLAVGLSDNSIALWDVKKNVSVARVRSPERCLLYSMRLQGDGIDALRVASGTIYNEIIVWKLSQSQTSLMDEHSNPSAPHVIETEVLQKEYSAIHLFRLTGHEGSIFRIAWSSDGSKLMSVSDDRSARIWMINGLRTDSGEQAENNGGQALVSHTLFGHNARIWDCYLSDSMVITASEDCTCRVWGMDGSQLLMIREHIGRGIWRCVYDPSSSLLVTAGFDSAIKAHVYHSASKEDASQPRGLSELKSQAEAFSICAPKIPKQLGLMNSKSEYIRCLHFTQENALYVATNNGYLYHVNFSDPGDVRWTELTHVSQEAPIICMDLMVIKSSENSEHYFNKEDIIALGDGKGNVTVIRIIDGDLTPKLVSCFTWVAEKERQLLGIFWCKLLGCQHIFTTNPGGILKLWKIVDTLESDANKVNVDQTVSLIAVFTTCFGARIMCLDVSISAEVLVCGDQRGNLTAFPLSEDLMVANSVEKLGQIPALCHFKGAHGISSVTSVLIATSESKQAEIRTTGGDGCICYFRCGVNKVNLEFIGMKQVKELSTIQSVVTKPATSFEDLNEGNYAIGFTSADFIMWDLRNETKTLQISCGGWRRPYSYHIGAVPEYQNCFAYVKDQAIYISRLWVPVHERQLFPKVLHMQYHGREVHSLCFISSCFSRKNYDVWIATGCEDGTVRLTRYMPFDIGNWQDSKLLGEHVGGSAVRSICFISGIYRFSAGTSYNFAEENTIYVSTESNENQFLLISVGAKQVLTSWILENKEVVTKEEDCNKEPSDASDISCPPLNEFSSISFRWLSTYMPQRFTSTHRRERLMEINEEKNSSTIKPSPISDPQIARCSTEKSRDNLVNLMDNDWRYLAVTGFLLKLAGSRLTVCFIAVSCSDATLSLRALVLPCRLWFDVGLLVPQTSPVLALQHVVVPVHDTSRGNEQIGNAYFIISGSTDGNITFWDVTEAVEHFMLSTIKCQPELLIGWQRRPQTGRGSQGGRWWKSSVRQSSGKNIQDSINNSEIGNNIDGLTSAKPLEALSVKGNDPSCTQTSSQTGSSTTNLLPERSSSILPFETCEVQPLLVLKSVHQSGVNCLHLSELKGSLNSRSVVGYCLLSGGDDQALHCVGFDFTSQATCVDLNHRQSTDSVPKDPTVLQCSGLCDNMITKHGVRILFRNGIASAHSSAVKGVWTDGIWAFSTGLDQRIRCWSIDHHGKLTENSHLIISVPEPEALSAVKCGRNKYQIAVGGRGMQVVEFSSCPDKD